MVLPAMAEWVWHDPMKEAFPVIQNQGFQDEMKHSYARLPDRAKNVVRPAVWGLSRNSAGLAIYFSSNATEIQVRYQVTGGIAMPHMPATGVSGIDLYRMTKDGEEQFCFGSYNIQPTSTYTYRITPSQGDSQNTEYRLYLPLYNSVKTLEIGVPAEKGTTFKFIPASKEKPIVLYGTSIAQGACASRPAMAWATILQRSLDLPLINLGFSGNGRLEPEVLRFIAEIDARMYILDCMPNLFNEEAEKITELATNAVRDLRVQHSVPILLVEHDGYGDMVTNENRRKAVMKSNQALRKAYEQLQDAGIQELYYISREELNLSPDGWVDGTHPTDLGMQQQAQAVGEKVRAILEKQ